MALKRVKLEDLPPLTPEQRAELARLAELPDDEIDFSDIPELDEAWFAEAVVWTPPAKKQITLRLDDDIIAFFKESGKGYQTRMNAVLRAFVDAKKKRA
ncbi:BrnA antitoxin family protein [Maricaulis sp.]|uniref:BrnA antitoxin family protein n=1 Tax=Maricaulis sp. TaxID=1486257 RepID=UPI002B27B696|nr:BrnA antitoxin family protein [Maricaulis sp.]